MKEILSAVVLTVVASVVLVAASIVYFGLNLWVIKTASEMFFGPGLDANWAVFSAALLSTGAVLAGALEKKSR